ncbi:DUF2793 domain-containing protein [Rhodovulum sp. DZ06]|uniref:DUF2793 domain-containing protein n=1 Tax=Rhodovulum sp. DZ06 TaxID=3425126 RepID=UPI003D3539D9
MTDVTPVLSLPFLAEGQANKHVPVNTSLRRLDALFMLSAKSRALTVAPTSPSEGDRWIVPAGATGSDWDLHPGEIAVFVNNGWDFVVPLVGWRIWVEDESIELVYYSGAWNELIVTQPAMTGIVQVLDFTHAPTGAVSDTVGLIPADAVVFGVTARVTAAITGPTAWTLGVPGAESRFGTGHGVALNAVVNGPTTAPLAHTTPQPLRLTAEGDPFSGGQVAFKVHYMKLDVPDPV